MSDPHDDYPRGLVMQLRSRIRELEGERDRLAGRVSKLTAELAQATEVWFDEAGDVTWRVPTAWAYAMACKTMHAQRARAEAAEGERDTATRALSDLPTDNDGKEQDAFEEWARAERFDMQTHPLHWLFLNHETNAARRGWRGALQYVAKAAAAQAPLTGDDNG